MANTGFENIFRQAAKKARSLYMDTYVNKDIPDNNTATQSFVEYVSRNFGWVNTSSVFGTMKIKDIDYILSNFIDIYNKSSNIQFMSKNGRTMVEVADQLVKDNKFLTAAEIYKKIGVELNVAECYVSAYDKPLAESLAELRLSDTSYTIDRIKNLTQKNLENALLIFEKNKKFSDAARCYLKLGQKIKAAKSYEKQGEIERDNNNPNYGHFFKKARILYEEMKLHEYSVRAFQRDGDLKKTASSSSGSADKTRKFEVVCNGINPDTPRPDKVSPFREVE